MIAPLLLVGVACLFAGYGLAQVEHKVRFRLPAGRHRPRIA